MALHTEWITYGGAGKYSGYIAYQQETKEPLPAVIVLQEIWGVDDHIQDITRRIAQAGYVALAPDLFAEGGKRLPELTDERIEQVKRFRDSLPATGWGDEAARNEALALLPEARREEVSGTLGKIFNLAELMPAFHAHIDAAAAFLRNDCVYSRRKAVGSIGFCLGGGLSAQLAARDPELRGAVIFYGSAPSEDAIGRIACPVLGLYGEKDRRITDGVPAFAEAMDKAGKRFDYHIYPDAPHAFFNDTRPSYHADSARDAFVRTLDFLRKQLV